MAFTQAIASAVREMTKAARDRISGHRLFRRSASHKQSQCGAVPGFQPEVACASCFQDIARNSSGYRSGTFGVSEDMLIACEEKAKAYRLRMSHDGLLSDDFLRFNLTTEAYLACFTVPELVAEVRRLRGLALSTHAS